MSLFISDSPIAICDRCRTKMRRDELTQDRNSPGLLVCRECNDKVDPYRFPWHPKDSDIHVDRPRPELPLDVPSTMTTVDANGRVVEGAIPVDLSVKPSSE